MPISELLDNLSCELLGDIFDQLAEGESLNVVASICNQQGERITCAFEDDSEEVCLERAYEWVRRGGAEDGASSTIKPQCYAIAYMGAVADGEVDPEDSDAFTSAVLLEFGERGASSGWSAYSYIDGVGEKENFRFTDPAPAGETECLL